MLLSRRPSQRHEMARHLAKSTLDGLVGKLDQEQERLKPIPVARPEAVPHATTLVEVADLV